MESDCFACQSSGYSYLTHIGTQTFIRICKQWKVNGAILENLHMYPLSVNNSLVRRVYHYLWICLTCQYPSTCTTGLHLFFWLYHCFRIWCPSLCTTSSHRTTHRHRRIAFFYISSSPSLSGVHQSAPCPSASRLLSRHTHRSAAFRFDISVSCPYFPVGTLLPSNSLRRSLFSAPSCKPCFCSMLTYCQIKGIGTALVHLYLTLLAQCPPQLLVSQYIEGHTPLSYSRYETISNRPTKCPPFWLAKPLL